MASQPSADDIAAVLGILDGLGEREALILLRKNGGNSERAVNAYFDDPTGSIREDVSATQWDHSMDNVPSFRIDADDTSTGAMPSMSRPNSRADNKQPVLDLSKMEVDAQRNLQERDEEQEQLDRAIAMSLNQPVPPPQENGVTGTGQQFGPATKDYYDESKWAVTAPVSSYREIIDHPSPAKRRRIEGQPAFLRGGERTGYLGALLTIYHGIPLAREALVLPPMKVLAYGYDSEWWAGKSDENRKSLTLEVDQHVDRNRLNLLAELQCLMAFLDNGNRAYASVDALADLQGLKTFQAEGEVGQLVSAWQDAAMSQCGFEQLTQVFSSTAAKSDGNVSVSRDLVCVEPPVNRWQDHTLTELLDSTVWNDSTDPLEDVWFQHCAEVFTVRMYDPEFRDQGLGVQASTLWYSDRYLEERKAESREIREELQAIRKDILHYVNIQKRCELMPMPGQNRKHVRIRDVLAAAAQAVPEALEHGQEDEDTSSKDVASHATGLIFELQSVMGRVEQKLNVLNAAKAELEAKMREVRKRMTEPLHDDDIPAHKYLLMGAATRFDTTYLRRRNTDLLGLEDEATTGEPSTWQWWRTSWITGTKAAPIAANHTTIGPMTQAQAEASIQSSDSRRKDQVDTADAYAVVKVTEKEVMDAITTEFNSVLLVYANEHAVNWKCTPLSDALRDFIARDNTEFASEIGEQTPSANFETPEPSDIIFEDVPLENSPTGSRLANVMEPMSLRDKDGQPSPKRPKSSDESHRVNNDEPPPYEDAKIPEMREKQNKIGLHSERMLTKYEDSGFLHLEHSKDLPR